MISKSTVAVVAFVALLVGAGLARADETRTVNATSDSTVVRTENPDGSMTVAKECEINFDNGKSLTVSEERTVARDEDGSRMWSGSRTVTDSEGRTATSTGQGSAVKTDDGVQWSRTASGTNRQGEAWSAETTGSGRRSESGMNWSSTTNGTHASGRSWTAERSGLHRRNEDGSRTHTGNATRRNSDGGEWSSTWERNGRQTGENSWSWNGSATITGKGGQRQRSTQGTAERDGNKVTRRATRTRSGGRRTNRQ